jgi:hypothetical protein
MRQIRNGRAVIGGLLCSLVAGVAGAQAPPVQAFSSAADRAAVVKVMSAVADWQLAHPSAHEPYDWTRA